VLTKLKGLNPQVIYFSGFKAQFLALLF